MLARRRLWDVRFFAPDLLSVFLYLHGVHEARPGIWLEGYDDHEYDTNSLLILTFAKQTCNAPILADCLKMLEWARQHLRACSQT